jgi:hypothetical protein
MIKRSVSAALASLFLTASAFAVGEGTAVGVNPDAVAKAGSADRLLVVGADVSVGEKIVTGPTGNVQLLFKDQTRLVVGPRSTLEIETYLLNGSGADKFAVNALAGTFRFISGNSAKSAYSINTPTASIAVRGTKFDVTVGAGQSAVMLYEGALTLCQGGTCVDLEDRCDIGALGGILHGAFGWGDEERERLLGNFPLSNIQSAFAPPFRVNGAQACLGPSPSGPASSIVVTPPADPVDNKNNNRTCTPPSNNC